MVDENVKVKVEELTAKGLKPQAISVKLGVPVSQVYLCKRKMRQRGLDVQVRDYTHDVDAYEPALLNNIKHVLLNVSHVLAGKKVEKESSTQLAKTMGILIDKLRLIEGKSTQNISAHIVSKLDPQQLEILNDMGKSLIQSMLK